MAFTKGLRETSKTAWVVLTVPRYNQTSCSINFGIQKQEEQKNKFNHKYIINNNNYNNNYNNNNNNNNNK